MNPRRRDFLVASAAVFASGCADATRPVIPAAPAAAPQPMAADELLGDLERRTFDFFWQTANPANGLVPDRWPTPSFASIAAVGFGLSAYPIGMARGWITRAQARDRVLATLRFFRDAPQGPAPAGTAGHRGFFYHFLDPRTGHRHARDVELSTVDTALLLAGAMHCQQVFDGADAPEAEIREAVRRIVDRVDWPWAQHRPPSICHGWLPEKGFIASDWKGYNEAMLVYLLALGSATHPVGPEAWREWTSTYGRSWQSFQGREHLHFPPLFGHQYSHVWVDFRGIRDDYMRGRDLDYFENSRRAVQAQRAYAIANPMGWKGYGPDVWGISACDGPADVKLRYRGEMRTFRTYAGRGAGGEHTYDDGTLAPTAAAASIAFAPELVRPALVEMHRRYGRFLYGTYGFLDSFNPSFDFDVKLRHGRRVPGDGWVADDYLGIDQGPILAMIANHRDEGVWRAMRRHPHIRRGLQRAGFTGGWLDAPA